MMEPLDLLPPLLEGTLLTIAVTVPSAILALLLAFLVGIARSRVRLWPVKAVLGLYVEVFRGSSALVQLFWFFFVLPGFGIDLSPFVTAVLVFGLNQGAYGSEVVRGSMNAVPRGQWEAARALNLGPRATVWEIIFPQALVSMIPPLANVMIDVLKGTALASLIFLSELTFVGQSLRLTTFRSAEIFSLVLIIYHFLARSIVWLSARAELRAGRGMRPQLEERPTPALTETGA